MSISLRHEHRGTSIRPGLLPGEDFSPPLELPAHALAHALAFALEVPVPRCMEIVRQCGGITRDMARRLASDSGTRLDFGTKMPMSYDRAPASKGSWRASNSGFSPPPGSKAGKWSARENHRKSNPSPGSAARNMF
jgi:plasmid maintenance system antidote protein VapI